MGELDGGAGAARQEAPGRAEARSRSASALEARRATRGAAPPPPCAPSGPPPWAMSGRPPPPCPPTASTALRTRSTALRLGVEIVGDADRDGGAAVVDRDQSDDARADARLGLVDQAAQRPWGRCPSSTWPMKPWPPTCSGPGRLGLAAAAQRQRLLRLGELALEPAALLEQGGDAGRHLLGRGLERGGGLLEPVLAARSATAARPRRSAPRSGGRRRRPRFREMILSSWMSPSALTWVPPHSSTE